MSQRKKFLLFLSVIFFILFILFSYLVAKEKFVHFDFDTTVKLQDRIPRRFDVPFSVFSILGLVELTSITWLIIVVWLLLKRFFVAAGAMILFWIGLGIELFGKVFVLHPAPPFFFYRGTFHFGFSEYYVHTDYSYPSGHVYRTSFLVAFLVIWAFLKLKGIVRLGIFTTLISFWILMMVSRIYLGEHWTTDVIGGALNGLSFGILAAIFIPLVKNHKGEHQID